MREKRRLHKYHYGWFRITPACAGKTKLLHNGHRIYQDHPRVCGKNFLLRSLLFVRPGSPPRVREKLSMLALSYIHDRITPACAGKTIILFVLLCDLIGSPPRVREKLNAIGRNVNQIGITPACAGKTFLVRDLIDTERDHPRVCGKNRKIKT